MFDISLYIPCIPILLYFYGILVIIKTVETKLLQHWSISYQMVIYELQGDVEKLHFVIILDVSVIFKGLDSTRFNLIFDTVFVIIH